MGLTGRAPAATQRLDAAGARQGGQTGGQARNKGAAAAINRAAIAGEVRSGHPAACRRHKSRWDPRAATLVHTSPLAASTLPPCRHLHTIPRLPCETYGFCDQSRRTWMQSIAPLPSRPCTHIPAASSLWPGVLPTACMLERLRTVERKGGCAVEEKQRPRKGTRVRGMGAGRRAPGEAGVDTSSVGTESESRAPDDMKWSLSTG